MRSPTVRDSLRVILLNARSIRNKFLEFRALIATENPDLVAVTESWLRTSSRDFEGEFAIPSYQMFHRDRNDRNGGGVLLYVKDSLNSVICSITSNHEFLGVDLDIGGASYRVLVAYKPDSSREDRTWYEALGSLVDGRLSLLMGDFNSPCVDWETTTTTKAEEEPLVEFVNDCYLTQWVKEPTREHNILDLVLTTEDDIIDDLSVGEHLGTSDHRIVRFGVRVPETEEVASGVQKLDFRRADFSGLRSGLAEIDMEGLGDAERLWCSFKDNFMSLQSRFVPLKRSGRGLVQPKWFSREIGCAIREKRASYNAAKVSGDFEPYRIVCRRVKSMIRAAKRAEELRVARLCKEDPKEFFSHVNSRKPVRQARIGPLKDEDGHLCRGDVENAGVLNSYFSTVFTVEDALNPEPSDIHVGNKLDSILFTEEEVKKKIGQLHKFKSPGPDGFLPRVLREVKEEVAPHLASIFNESIRSGCVPRDWRLADITPIFKKGDRSQPSNYRPISLTSIVGKLMESVIVDRISDHMESNNLLRNSQHGFRRRRSCLTNLLEFFHNVFTEHDRDKAVDVIYLDFQKAFDKVPYRRLLSKVRALGIDGMVANWIENWLRDRRQRVVVNGKHSEWAPVTSGVPQGSVLGPLLFIIYINDIDDGILAGISKFADDTKLGMNVSQPENIRQLQEDLRKIGEWSEKWQMPFNANKCKVMHIGYRNPRSEYSLQGTVIESTEIEKDLGVVISSDLKFSKQCLEAEKKAQRMLGYIKRQFGFRNKEIVLSLYNSLVRPHLEYAVQFWCPSQRGDIDRLERVQRRATKLIPSIRNRSYEDRLRELNLFTLEQRRLRGQLIEVFKILRGFDNVDYRNLFELSEGRTRNHGYKLVLKRFNRDVCGNYFTYSICGTWNSLPTDVVNSDTVEQFKTRLDRVLRRL